MNAGSYEHVSSCLAANYGLRWNDRKLALKELGAGDCVFNLFFVSVSTESSTNDYLYLVNRVAVTTDVDGMRVKLPYFAVTERMIEHLNQVNHRLWYVTIGDELVRIKDKSIDKISTYLSIRRNNCCETWFEQDVLCSDMSIKQPYIPRRGKCKKLDWVC